MYYTCITMSSKVNKSFRFTKEVADILDRQDNATQYIENLVLGGTRNVNIGLQAANQIQEMYVMMLESNKQPTNITSEYGYEDLL